MRLRRHGDPERGDKRGPKPSVVRKGLREMFPEMSPRTFARYYEAFTLLHWPGVSEEDRKWAHEQSTRHGRLNVSKLLDIAITLQQERDSDD